MTSAAASSGINVKMGLPRVGILAVAALAFGLLAPALSNAQVFQTIAPVVVLMDADTQSVLFEKSADQPVTPASTVKIMTAELVFREIKEGRLRLENEFTISENAWRTGGAMARGSSMFAGLHTRVKVEDLLRGLLIVSGNDAGIALAEGIAGSDAAFAQKMTQRARDLGLRGLTFRNSWGKDDPAQKVTARDMALLAEHLIRTYPDLYKYFAEKEFTWNRIKQQNRNPLLNMDLGADGLKTGNIDEASGYGLVDVSLVLIFGCLGELLNRNAETLGQIGDLCGMGGSAGGLFCGLCSSCRCSDWRCCRGLCECWCSEAENE